MSIFGADEIDGKPVFFTKKARPFCQDRSNCDKPATKYYVLMTRIVYRCDEHEDCLISTVFAKGPVLVK